MIAPKRKRLYFKYSGKLVFDDSSYNVIGTDLHPRYRVVPEVLKEIMGWSPSAASTTFGYVMDEETGLYLKNLDITDETAVVEFLTMKLKPPFGYHSAKTYSEYTYRTFNDEYQAILKRHFDSSPNTKFGTEDLIYIEDTFTYFYTLITKKEKDENDKPYVRVSFD